MNKSFLFLILSFFALHENASAFTFKIATLSPDGSYWMEKMRQGAKEISDKTENRVKFKFYPGGVMGDDKSVFRKIRLRQLHGAALTNGSFSEIYPDIRLYNLILKFDSLNEIDFVRSKMDPLLIDGLSQKGIVSFGFAEIGQAYLTSINPIHSLTDMKGQKAWVPSNNQLAKSAFEAFQVSPIPLPIRDVLMGLQTGIINVAIGSPIGAITLQWHTKIKYITDLPISYIFGVFMLDQKAFAKITEDDQKIVADVYSRVMKQIDQQSRKDNLNAFNALNTQGIKFIKPTPQAIVELKKSIHQINLSLTENKLFSKQLLIQLDKTLSEFRRNNHASLDQ